MMHYFIFPNKDTYITENSPDHIVNHANSTTLHASSFQHLDSPATTSALVYKIYLARLNASSGYGRILANSDDSFSITAMEISQ